MSTARSTARAVLLGPQRLAPILDRALERLGVGDVEVAVITAGWQEREREDGELCDALGRRGVNLTLHARGDDAFRRDPDLFRSHRAKQDQLKQLQELYRRRLGYHMAAARHLQRLRRRGEDTALSGAVEFLPSLVNDQLRSELAGIRALDAEHLALIGQIEDSFAAAERPAERPAIARHRGEIADILARTGAVAIAGGHVAVIVNRLRLFELAPLLAGKPILAWSAGAMAITERIVLFHDTPPQGRGHAEVMGRGLSLVRGVVALPHASRRLMLDNPERIGLMARRFAPAACVALDARRYVVCPQLGAEGSDAADADIQGGPGTVRLGDDGACVPLAAEEAA